MKKWVSALRSGKYEQGQEYLNSQNKFCCLGVLCEVAKKNGVELKIEVDEEDNTVSYNGSNGVLSKPVMNWAGIQNICGSYINSRNQEMTLTGLNDTQRMSFKQIANIIEKVYEKL